MNDHDYAAFIREAHRAASAEDISAGRDWYPTAGRMIAELAAWSGLPADRVAAMVAALSPRNPWRWNVADAAAFADAIVNGRPMPSATTFGQNRTRAWAFGNGTGDWTSAAPKVRSFVRNMTGDYDAVTVDVWAVRVATNGERSAVGGVRRYEAIAAAYRLVAAEVGESPAALQAIVWVAAQRSGLGQSRKTRHGETCKRGTLPIVAAMFAETN